MIESETNRLPGGKVTRVLAIASGGGHWEQLMTIRPAFADCKVHYVTTMPGLPERNQISSYSIVPDCNRSQPIRSVACVLALVRIVLVVRPGAIVTTGALPGAISVIIGRLLGATTIWIDSVANAEELSMSGRLVKRFSSLWLTQWPEVAERTGASYAGSVL